jgi:6,7-dimethyl-8-ribityllumazine synthase
MSTSAPKFKGEAVSPDARFAIVVARFNSEITDALLDGCLRRFAELAVCGDRVQVHHVPGAFELPVAALALINARRFSAVVCLGCVIRGDTPHFDFVAGETARGIQQVAIRTGVPVIFGVLTTNTAEQARARIDASSPYGHAGMRAAEAAVEMAALMERIVDKGPL